MRKWIYINDEKTRYKISSKGFVVSMEYNGKKGDVRKLKHNHDKDGYCIITLNHKGKKYTRKIHRLVADAFIKNPLNLPEVNHKNGNKDDNDFTNLEWVDGVENIHHALNNNLRYSLNSEEFVIEVCQLLESGKYSYKEISKMTGISVPSIKKIRYGINWKSISKNYDFSNFNKFDYTKGSNNKSSTINENEVMEICKLLEDHVPITEISKITNASISQISHIKHKDTWVYISKDYNF